MIPRFPAGRLIATDRGSRVAFVPSRRCFRMTPSVRYRRIVGFFSRVVLQLIAWEWILPRIGFRAVADRTRSARLHRTAASFRALAIEMGGVLIKVGQFLSSRVDVLPEEVTSELAGLQDEVPPEQFADVRAV